MEQYISKDALEAEIEKRIKEIDEIGTYLSPKGVLTNLLCHLNTLEVKEINEELQGLEKEVAEGTVDRINKKRIPIELKGEVKAKFKNEFHTMWQTIHGISFANVAKPILERLCLHFAAWGVYNLKEYIKMKPEEEAKLDTVKVKEVNLEEEIASYIQDNTYNGYLRVDIYDAAEHFFELGLKKAQKGE